MRRWSLQPNSPLSLVLASDVRLSQTDYVDDQIWELSLGWGSPPGIVAETTFGLRARSMRVFPSFRWEGDDVTEIERFHRAPQVRLALPNFVRLGFSPYRGVEVSSEYWVPGSQCLAGRMTVRTVGSSFGSLRARIHASLVPREPGQALGEETIEGASVLTGRTESLVPVLFATGGAQVEATYSPALAIERPVSASQPLVIQWALVAKDDLRSSFDGAREALRMSWEEETARIERVNGSLIEFRTGSVDWDAALHFAQTTALGACVRHDGWLPHPSLVSVRDADSGYSVDGSGRDHDEGWSGQKSTHTAYLIQQLLPISPGLAKGLLRNLIHVQDATGGIDGRPGLAGQRQGSNAVPLLARAAWRVYAFDRDREFLEEVYHRLGQFVGSWLAESSDIDRDGAPEWVNTLQADFPNWPTFARWHEWGENFNIHYAETADLVAYLLSEVRSLERMAAVLERKDEEEGWSARADSLFEQLRTWPRDRQRFLPRERDTHECYSGKPIATISGTRKKLVKAALNGPVRLVVRVAAEESSGKDIEVRLVGRSADGRFTSEKVTGHDLDWYWRMGSYTTRALFQSVESVRVSNAPANSRTQVFVPDLRGHDLTQLLPMWALAEKNTREIDLPIELLREEGFYWCEHGVPAIPAGDPLDALQDDTDLVGVRMDWNAMLGEALVELQDWDAAADLLSRLLDTSSQSLRGEHGWRECYHPRVQAGAGRRHSVVGAPPVGLFLKVVGIQLHTPWEVDITGPFPFDSPMTISWRGLEVMRSSDMTEVTFPNGYVVVSPGSQPRRILQERTS